MDSVVTNETVAQILSEWSFLIALKYNRRSLIIMIRYRDQPKYLK
jgi:hypothetical protein